MGEKILYHGSPYDFNTFDINVSLTGAGAQRYGHGIYLSENKEVAEEYAVNLIWVKNVFTINDSVALAVIKETGGDESLIDTKRKFLSEKTNKNLDLLLSALENNEVHISPAVLYTVKMGRSAIIDLSKPMSSQSKEIIEIVKMDNRCFKSTGGVFGKYTGDQTGHDYWLESLRVFGDMEKASDHYARLGIDGFCFENDSGLHRDRMDINYVLFHSGRINISEKQYIEPPKLKKRQLLFSSDSQNTSACRGRPSNFK